MRIKKFKKNEYILADNSIWVRNPCLNNIKPIDINALSDNDKEIILKNELENIKLSKLEIENLYYDNIIICSDGYGWEEKQKILAEIPTKTKIICVNGALKKWNMAGAGSDLKRIVNFYIVNNPFEDCLQYFPFTNLYFPNLLASTKTNFKFTSNYKGEVYFYRPPEELNYSGVFFDSTNVLDDYRNPICAAISFAYKVQAKKILLFCCDESFDDVRPSAIQMNNKLYQYPQQILSQKIMDKQLFWIKKETKIFDHSKGIKYENAEYINEENIKIIFG